MASSKRPPPPENPNATVMVGADDADEDLVSTSARQVSRKQAPAPEPVNDGATAFVRVDQAPPADDFADGAGSTMRSPEAPSDDEAGATAFVRVDRAGAPAPPPARRPAKEPLAPKKGLQVQLPDDEPAPAPKPKPKPAPEPAGKKGRRGAWWDEEAAKIPDEPEPPPEPEPEPEPAEESEHDGATAMFNVEDRKPKAGDEPEVAPPKRAPEPEVYKPVPADDYGGNLQAGPARWKVWLKRALVASVVLFVLGVGALVGGYLYVVREIPPFESMKDYKPFVATQVVAEDGTLLGQFFREKRTVVKIEEVPRVLVNAVISSEDKDFYKHAGVNPLALARAVVVDLLSGRKRLGASTITQQVVKNFFLTREKKIKRKVKEILLAARLERNLSKDEILSLYLNQINFGRAHYGVEQASQFYFGKHVQELELGEAALLAGLPQNPTRLNPRRHPARAKERQKYVLGRMLANKYITREEYDREVERPLSLPPLPPEPAGAWYLDEVKRQLVAQYGEAPVETAGYRVEVAMVPRLQEAAEQAVQDGLRAVDKRQGWHGPVFKVEAAQVPEVLAALGRMLAAASAGPDTLLVADLDEVPEKEQGSPEAIARRAVISPLVLNGLYAGVVTAVNAREARVALSPGVEGPVPFSTMQWARPFKPEGRTPAPSTPRDVVAPGDVVLVRVAALSLTRAGNQRKVANLVFALEQTPLVQGALAAIDLKTRAVLALVGGYDIKKSQFNRATQAKRQPGSAFKPFLYAAALESGKYTPATRVDDSPEVITDPWSGKPWKPQNFEKDEFAGPMSLRKAFAESKNTVAVRMLLDLGLDKVRAQAIAAGLASPIPQSYTAALGTGEVGVLEIINAYATLGSQGRKAEPVLIRKVTSREGNIIFRSEVVPEPSMRADTAYLTADVMRSVIEDPDGTARSLGALGRPAAGKTGTASEHRDGWFIGFTPSVVAGAWVGFDDHRMLGSLETGGHCAGPIWLQFMREATRGASLEPFGPPPPGVVELKVNRNTGEPAAPDDPFGVREVFMAGTEPKIGEAPPSQDQFFQSP